MHGSACIKNTYVAQYTSHVKLITFINSMPSAVIRDCDSEGLLRAHGGRAYDGIKIDGGQPSGGQYDGIKIDGGQVRWTG